MQLQTRTHTAPIPVAFFGISLGLLALANAWRVAVRIWPVPSDVADGFAVAAFVVWIVILAAYARKWLMHRAQARDELRDPLQSSFAALGPISSLLAANLLADYSRAAAIAVFAVAALAQLALGIYLHGRFWQGGRHPEQVTPAVYLPTVAPGFVAGSVAATFGWTQVGMMFFGAGLLSWLAIESLILHRAAVHTPLPEAQRPLLGIQVAPALVGGVSYMSLSHGAPDLFAYALLGYGLFQAALILRLLPWIRRQPFAPSYWSFTFGAAALPTLAMRIVERGATGSVELLAPVLFIAANGVIGAIAFKTLVLLWKGRLLPVAEKTPALPIVAGPRRCVKAVKVVKTARLIKSHARSTV